MDERGENLGQPFMTLTPPVQAATKKRWRQWAAERSRKFMNDVFRPALIYGFPPRPLIEGPVEKGPEDSPVVITNMSDALDAFVYGAVHLNGKKGK